MTEARTGFNGTSSGKPKSAMLTVDVHIHDQLLQYISVINPSNGRLFSEPYLSAFCSISKVLIRDWLSERTL